MRELTPAQIKYVLFHLNHHARLKDGLENRFHFTGDQSLEGVSKQVVFLLSDKEIDLTGALQIDGLPVLFPLTERKDFYFFDAAGNLIFGHDLLKAIFYLLSGYQEYQNQSSRDSLNRFSLQESIQFKLGVVGKPLVNYYIGVLMDGLQQFCSRNDLPFQRRTIFKNFGFLLTHDIDVVDYYTYNFLGYKLKEIIGLKKSKLSTGTNIKLFVHGLLKYSGITKKDNPYWSFDYLRRLEKSHNLKSVFFFLDQGIKNHDAHYAFEEERVLDLFNWLKKEHCEIGLHGTVKSGSNVEVMNRNKERLSKASNSSVTGNRQHRLLWEHPLTAQIEERIGLKYDSTLGFAAHEGFRNSYCWPYKLYNFEEDRMLDVWEFPLNVMDVTLFAYQRYTPTKALEKCNLLLDEIQKFGGVFTLLWHNSFFDEDLYPGITKFYETLLEVTAARLPENKLGNELVTLMENHSQ